MLESFSSFYASAFKEVIVFTLIIPVLLWRSFQHGPDDDEEMSRMTFRRIALARLRASRSLALHAASLPVPEFWITQANYIGLYTLVVHRPGAAHRRRRPDLVRPGRLRRHGCLHRRLPHASRTASRRGSRSGSAWRSPASPRCVLGWITLRMSGHYLPLATIAWGLSALLPARQPRRARQVRRPARHPGDLASSASTSTPGGSFFYLLWIIVVARRASPSPTCSIRAPAARCAPSRAARRWPRRWASTPSASRSPRSCSRRCSRASRGGCSRTSSAP